MEKYLFCYENGRQEVYEVQDIFHFNTLLNEIDKHFIKLYKWDGITDHRWKEVTR